MKRNAFLSLPFALVAIGVALYITFTLLCLESGGQDGDAGALLLLNLPLLLCWLAAQAFASRFATAAGVASAGAQVTIGIAMIALEIGDAALVSAVNSGIVFGILLLVWIGQNYERWSAQLIAITSRTG